MDLLYDETREELAYFWKPSAPSYVRPTARPGTFWGDLVSLELKWIWWLRRSLDSQGAGLFLRQFISNNPYRDISLITWALTIIGWWEHGVQMFWVTTINAFASVFLRAVLQSPRPFEFDRRLRPLADRQITGYGFPSVESYMAVVTYGYLALKQSHPAWQSASVAMCLFIGITRIYAGSRFIHQILFSWILGGLALWLYMTFFAPYVPDWGGSLGEKNVRIALMAPWVLVFFAYICLAAEENSSGFLSIPKTEFIQVISGIMDIGAASAQQTESGSSNAQTQGGDGASLPTLGLSARERRRRRLSERQDSFYFLQHSMRAKDMERRDLIRQRATEAPDDDDAQ